MLLIQTGNAVLASYSPPPLASYSPLLHSCIILIKGQRAINYSFEPNSFTYRVRALICTPVTSPKVGIFRGTTAERSGACN